MHAATLDARGSLGHQYVARCRSLIFSRCMSAQRPILAGIVSSLATQPLREAVVRAPQPAI